MKIIKHPLTFSSRQTIWLPTQAQILTVQAVRGELQLWALCDPALPNLPRHLAIYEPEDKVPAAVGRYISTVQMKSGTLVYHVFELLVT